MNAQELTLAGLAVVPMIVALTELAKLYVPGKFAPLVALVLGVGAGIAAQASLPHPLWINGVVTGTAAGLAACGLYSGIQALSQPPALAVTQPGAEPTPTP